MLKIKNKLYDKYNIFTDLDHDNTVEILNLIVKALAGRIKRYEDLNNRKNQNKMFSENQHSFYRSLGNLKAPTELPTKEALQEFCTSILSQPITYNRDARWIADEGNKVNSINTHTFEEINVDMVKDALRKTHNARRG